MLLMPTYTRDEIIKETAHWQRPLPWIIPVVAALITAIMYIGRKG